MYMWERQVDLERIVEIRTKTIVYFGVGAISQQ